MKALKESLFSKKNLDNKSNKYGITEKDMIGQIKDFPVGVVVRMMEEMESQYGDANIEEFQEERDGGFVWNDSDKGYNFWNIVIRRRRFDLFFDEYPEYIKYNL